MNPSIEYKLRKVLILFGFLLFCILVRVWFLSVINYEKMHKLSVLPRRRTQMIAPTRGVISDCNGKKLACNQKRFDVAICYQDIKEIPQVRYKIIDGKKTRVLERKNYIKELSTMLSLMLDLSFEEIEDFIYAKAAIFQDSTLVLKQNIPDSLYPILKLKEKDWPGLKIITSQTRVYPQEKTGCHIVGYIGPIDESTYRQLNEEKNLLKTYIDQREQGLIPPLPQGYMSPYEVRYAYDQLVQKSYQLQDFIGKDGIEKTFDTKLRGSPGKLKIETKRTGDIITTLPGSYEKTPPASIQLSIDLDLQKKAEALLAERETDDELFSRGGAICVIDMKTQQVLALASYPRFNPQDFIDKNTTNIHRWTESDRYIENIYEGIVDIEKEQYDQNRGFFEKKQKLTYTQFLKRIVSESSYVFKLLSKLSVYDAYLSLDSFEKLFEKHGFGDIETFIEDVRKDKFQDEESKDFIPWLKQLIHDNPDPILTLDLIRLLIDTKKLNTSTITLFQSINLETYFDFQQKLNLLENCIKNTLKAPFEALVFDTWKKMHFKEFLHKKRQEESQKKTWARPYTEYLEKEKNRQFEQFIKKYRLYFNAYVLGKIPKLKTELSIFTDFFSDIQKMPLTKKLACFTQTLTLDQTSCFLKSFRKIKEMNKTLYGHYPRLLDKQHHLEKDLAKAFYPKYKLGYLRSNAYRFLAPQGSVFKVAVSYEALKEKSLDPSLKLPILFDELKELPKNTKDQILGFDEHRNPIKRWHKGGLLPRSSHAGIGRVDLPKALEQSSNIYFSILAADFLKNPNALVDTAQRFGLGQQTGIELPYEPKGKLPQDLMVNKTGLYAFAIGQHELLVTPLQTTIMIASLFQNGSVFRPSCVKSIKEIKPSVEEVFNRFDDALYKNALGNLGCFFPLFTENMTLSTKAHQDTSNMQLLSKYWINDAILDPIKKGLNNVVWGEKGTARPQAIASFLKNEKQLRSYLELRHKMIGKTGTAEQLVFEKLDKNAPGKMLNHIWFASVSFTDETQQVPELAICVYLKDGKLGGKEAAPIAAKMIQAFKQKNKGN